MFGMGTGGSSSLRSPRKLVTTGTAFCSGSLAFEYLTGQLVESSAHRIVCAVEFYGQAERAISNGKLNVLLRLHIRPIKQVVFLCSS